MLSLSEARAAILARIRLGTLTEAVPLLAAAGRYVAAPLRAQVDNPAFDNSAMDGYALAQADVVAQAGSLLLVGESRCGHAPSPLAPGTAMRIFTGAPLPAGADTVVMQEEATPVGDRIRFPAELRLGAQVRRRAEDFRTGDTLYTPGQRLTPADVSLLAAAGVAMPAVRGRPRVLVVATGDELVASGLPLAPGQIYESNRIATLLQLQALGAEAVDGGTVRDTVPALQAVLAQSQDYDFVITSGGASVGDHDLVKQVFADIGDIEFWRVKIKPGKPVAFGRIGARSHFFALPGNPVSSFITFKLFVEPALYAWHGGQMPHWQLPAVVINTFTRQSGRLEFLRARLWSEGHALRAECLAGQGSHMIGTLRHTNGLIVIDEDSTGFTAGDNVTVMPLF